MFILITMGKIHKNLSIDDTLNAVSTDNGWNMSEILEEAIKDKMQKASMAELVKSEHKCDFCGKPDRLASRDDLEGLTWLWPDERWICESCLKRKSAAIAISGGIHG